MAHIFISHAEEDKRVAIELARLLGENGYDTWHYEQNSSPGLSYLLQIPKAIDEAMALILVISRCAFASQHVDNEVTRAVQQRKLIIPLLYKLTHEEFEREKPDWDFAIGATVSLPLQRYNLSAAVPAIVSSLNRLSTAPQALFATPPASRWERLWRAIRRHPMRAAAGALGVVAAIGLLSMLWWPEKQVKIRKASGLFEVAYNSGSFDYSFEVEVSNSGVQPYMIADITARIAAPGLPAGDADQFSATDRECVESGTGEKIIFPYPVRSFEGKGAKMKCTIKIEPTEAGVDALQRLDFQQQLEVIFKGPDGEDYPPLHFCFKPKGSWPVKTEGHGGC